MTIVSALGPLDIVLVEGFHDEARAKIEVLSERTGAALCKTDENLIAIITPSARPTAVPSFAPSSITPLVDLIEKKMLGKLSTGARNESKVPDTVSLQSGVGGNP